MPCSVHNIADVVRHVHVGYTFVELSHASRGKVLEVLANTTVEQHLCARWSMFDEECDGGQIQNLVALDPRLTAGLCCTDDVGASIDETHGNRGTSIRWKLHSRHGEQLSTKYNV